MTKQSQTFDEFLAEFRKSWPLVGTEADEDPTAEITVMPHGADDCNCADCAD